MKLFGSQGRHLNFTRRQGGVGRALDVTTVRQQLERRDV